MQLHECVSIKDFKHRDRRKKKCNHGVQVKYTQVQTQHDNHTAYEKRSKPDCFSQTFEVLQNNQG